MTDASFDFDRSKKKRAERDRESSKREESRRHKERESYSILSKGSSDSSVEAFTSILDVKNYNSHREIDENRSREVKSHKVNVEEKEKRAYLKSYLDPKVHLNSGAPHSQSDGRDRGQELPSKTSTTGSHQGQNWTYPAPATAEWSRGTVSDPEKTKERGEESRSEHMKDKKQKSHKKEKRRPSPDEEKPRWMTDGL